MFDDTGALVRRNYSLNELDPGTALYESFQQGLSDSFSFASWSDNELIKANMGEEDLHYGPFKASDPEKLKVLFGVEKKLSQEDAEQQIKAQKLPLSVPDEGYTQKALNIVMERKKNELMRKAQIEDSTGFYNGTVQFSANVAAQMLDPVNIALSFMPVMAPAKYAALLAGANNPWSKAAIRAGIGAIEGGAGALAVEPAIYQAKQREQADYDMTDSLWNVALGTIIGGGLHAGTGALADWKAKKKNTIEPQGAIPRMADSATPETREKMLRTAVQMEIQGFNTDVRAVASMDPAFNYKLNPVSRAIESARHADSDLKIDVNGMFDDAKKARFINYKSELEQEYQSKKTDLISRGDRKKIRHELKTIEYETNKIESSFKEIAKENQRVGLSRKQAESAAREVIKKRKIELNQRKELLLSKIKKSEAVQNIRSDISRLNSGVIPDRFASDEMRFSELEKDINNIFSDGSVSKESHAIIKDIILSAEKGDDINSGALFSRLIGGDHVTENPGELLKNTVENGFKPENMRGSDKKASDEIEVKNSIPERNEDQELEQVQAMFDEYEKMLGQEQTDLSEYDKAISNAELDANALEAALTCRLTK